MNNRKMKQSIIRWGLDEKIIRSPRCDRKAVYERMLAIKALYFLGGYKQQDIAAYIQRSQSTVAKCLAKFQHIRKAQPELEEQWLQIRNKN